jgi:hypothetical protein
MLLHYRRNGGAALGGVTAAPFVAGAEGVAGESAVDGEDGVEVVHFVTVQLREGP